MRYYYKEVCHQQIGFSVKDSSFKLCQPEQNIKPYDQFKMGFCNQQYGRGSPKNWNNYCRYFIFVLLMFQPLSVVKCQCQQNRISQSFYVTSASSCTIKFNPCSDYSVTRCIKIQCSRFNVSCKNTMQTTNTATCKQYCCNNSKDLKNSDKMYSLKMCNQQVVQESQGSPSVGGYVLIATLTGGFVFLVIVICICRRRRHQPVTNQNLNQNVVYPHTNVDLNSYSLEAEGPYFVNSNDTCAICLDSKVNLRTHCNHFYHGKCLLAWIKKKPNNPCPLCMSIQYNPVKVYCQQCHTGDKLVLIQPQTSQTLIKDYDCHKCENCKKFGNQTFTLSDQGIQKPGIKGKSMQQKESSKNLQQQKQMKPIQGLSQKNSSRLRRRNRKVESLKQVSLKSKQDLDYQRFDHTQKKFHPNMNNTSLEP